MTPSSSTPDCPRHSQARWLAMCIRDAGEGLPSRSKWHSLRKLATDFLGLIETSGFTPATGTTPSGHDRQCQWHCEQYPWECDCGKIAR